VAILIYLFPALIDGVVAQLLFVNSVRAAQMGCRDLLIACFWTAWSIPYVLTCMANSRWLNERNAGRCLVISAVLLSLSCIGNLFAERIQTIYLWTVIPAVGAGLFFPPFQVFMKRVDRGHSRSVAWSTGMYTFSWSAGFAVGPWVSGHLMELGSQGWRWCFVLGAVVASVSGVVLYWMDRRDPGRTAPLYVAPVATADESLAAAPDLAWLGWIGAGGGLIALTVFRSIFPAMGEKLLHLAESVQGNVFFLVSGVQAIVGLIMCRSRVWMYRAVWVGGFGLLGILAPVLWVVSGAPAVLYLAAIAFGIYTGSFYFYLVFHALAHPHRAPQYVSINEIVVGLTGLVTPVLAGWLAETSGSYRLTFGFAAGVVLVTVIIQVVVHGWIRPWRHAPDAGSKASVPTA